jgi:hypothetical protein
MVKVMNAPMQPPSNVVPPMPDMRDVVAACRLVARADVSATAITVRCGDVQTFVMHAQEIADEHGLHMQITGGDGHLTLRFSNESHGARR